MKKSLFFVLIGFSSFSFAQKEAPHNWQLMDPKVDKIYGAGVEQAYITLKDKSPKPVIVAVIDGGTDVEHEDLKDIIWTNPGEIPDNGIDDDKNGYIDDVHGWNFLGGKNGDINYEATELARMYHRGVKKYYNIDDTRLSPEETKEYDEFKKIKTIFLTEQAKQQQQMYSINLLEGFVEKVKSKNNGVFSKDALKNYQTETEIEGKIKKGLKLALTFGLKPEELTDQLKQGKEQFGNLLKYNQLNTDSIRAYLVGDSINNPNERYYGNNHVKGPDARHGSHVAGIIAAIRTNTIGINGVANNVKIMVVRAVPNGDERDKDVANAIRYAVDNGATVINMSFGKYYSPDKKVIDDAVEYAISKDVLLLHAAGNESKNRDVESSFPSRELLDGKIAENWIEVGASSFQAGKKIIGSFSNYGKTKVDLFAPGVDIYSTVPDSKYEKLSGTSMACPSTAGVAALIREYFPELKAEQVRAVLMKTVVPYKKSVIVPGTKKDKKTLAELCISGGFVNANNAARELMGLNKQK